MKTFDDLVGELFSNKLGEPDGWPIMSTPKVHTRPQMTSVRML